MVSSTAGLDASGCAGATGFAFSPTAFSATGGSSAAWSFALGLMGSTSFLTGSTFTGGGVTTLLGVSLGVSATSGVVFSVTAGAIIAAPREMRGV